MNPTVAVRLPAKVIAGVDDWAAANQVSRSEAFRHIVERGLEAVHAEPADARKPAPGTKTAPRKKTHPRRS